MSFLAPWFLGAIALIGLPVVFHLLRRRPQRPQLFSSLMFLEPGPPVTTERRRLEDLLLLLLRCLVVVLLAMAFARPFLPEITPPAAEASARRVAILVDTSASMKRAGMWEALRARFETVLGTLRPGDEFAVIAYDASPRTLVSLEQGKDLGLDRAKAQARDQLAATAPSWRSTALGQAMAAAVAVLGQSAESLDQGRAREVVVLSDLAAGARLEGLQGLEWPRNTRVRLDRIVPSETGNAGVEWLPSKEPYQTASNLTVRVRVRNSSSSKVEQFKLAWEGHAGVAEEVHVPAGQSRTLGVARPSGEPGSARLVLSGDGVDFDNGAHVVFARPLVRRVRVVSSGRETNPDSALFYLRRAFQGTGPATVDYAVVQSLDGVRNDLTLVLDGVDASGTDGVRRRLDQGEMVLWVVSSAASGQALAAVAGEGTAVWEERGGARYALLGEVDFNHPWFKPFADARYSDFTKLPIWKYWRSGTAMGGQGRVLARFDSGDPAVVEWSVGRGRLYGWLAGWGPKESQVTRSTKFIPLLFSLLDQAGGGQDETLQFLVGEVVPLPPGEGRRLVRVGGGQDPEPVEAGARALSGREIPGVYQVEDPRRPWTFAVNLDAMESRTEPLGEETLSALGVPLKPELASDSSRAQAGVVRRRLETEEQQKAWRWLLVAGLVFLFLETWLAGRIVRRAAPVG